MPRVVNGSGISSNESSRYSTPVATPIGFFRMSFGSRPDSHANSVEMFAKASWTLDVLVSVALYITYSSISGVMLLTGPKRFSGTQFGFATEGQPVRPSAEVVGPSA